MTDFYRKCPQQIHITRVMYTNGKSREENQSRELQLDKL